jgi:predicted ester cyclase
MVKDFTLSLWRAFPDIYYTPLQDVFLSPGQPRIAHRFTLSGTMLGPFPPGFAPTGKHFEIDGFEMFEFRNEKIHRLISRFDCVKTLEQLGLLPPRLKAGSRKARIAVSFQRPIAWYQRKFPSSG